jgi:hypothetical protein
LYKSISAILLLSSVTAGQASAQNYLYQQPYQPPRSYTIQTPGQMPTYVNPTPGGGYTVQTPGQMPTYINPNPGGGYTVNRPGQMPTYIRPN